MISLTLYRVFKSIDADASTQEFQSLVFAKCPNFDLGAPRTAAAISACQEDLAG